MNLQLNIQLQKRKNYTISRHQILHVPGKHKNKSNALYSTRIIKKRLTTKIRSKDALSDKPKLRPSKHPRQKLFIRP